ncbi:MAG: UDP-N-acetylglucosamine--N-acetylmuramyl-(pentapeptide) pyrophosphoryl-undecaprenol N-acetylglucosamine transferase [bacterium]
MKILLTGGGTGGHFYPLIAVAEELHAVVKEKKLLNSELYFMSDTPYNKSILFDNGIEFIKVPTGKYRRYFSLLNFFDIFKTAYGVLYGFFRVFSLYPDVIFSKGGYSSFPALLAGRILGIPIIIHESDTVPGKVNLWAGKFAEKIALSYPEAETYFPKERVAWTGNPLRKEILIPIEKKAQEFFNLEDSSPIILVLGGSQGSETINNALIDALPQLVAKYQIIHQTGTKNIKEVSGMAKIVLGNNPHLGRYKPLEYLNPLALRVAGGGASLVITRAGSTLFEIAIWGVPAIVIPISSSNGDHQRKNAFAYARAGAGVVIEENNLTPEILLAQIENLMGDVLKRQKMTSAAHTFGKHDAARTIAEGLINIALTHEQ